MLTLSRATVPLRYFLVRPAVEKTSSWALMLVIFPFLTMDSAWIQRPAGRCPRPADWCQTVLGAGQLPGAPAGYSRAHSPREDQDCDGGSEHASRPPYTHPP